MRDRALCRGLQGNMETEVGELGGNSPTGKGGAARTGQAGLSPRAGGSPSLGTHVCSSVCSFLGKWADREAAAQSLHQRLSPMEPQLPGEAPGPRRAAAAVCARATSQPWEPLPGTSLAFPTSSQPLLGAKQLPVILPPAPQPWQPPGACAQGKARGMPRVAAAAVGMARPQARDVCAPHALSLAVACVSSCVVPLPSSNRSPCFLLQKRLKMPASRPSATGPTWKTLSS